MVELLNLKRTEIRRLWQETSASSAQIAEFEAFGVNDEAAFTDALLEEHEAMVATLQQRLETMQPLLKLVKKYYEAVEARAQLVEFQKDKERLKGRGAAKQLKLEEQMGKKIKQMPKIIESLTKQVKEWEAANGSVGVCDLHHNSDGMHPGTSGTSTDLIVQPLHYRLKPHLARHARTMQAC